MERLREMLSPFFNTLLKISGLSNESASQCFAQAVCLLSAVPITNGDTQSKIKLEVSRNSSIVLAAVEVASDRDYGQES